MSKKEIKLQMGFMDENGNLVEIPENIQKHIEAREEFWANKIKDIDSKCGIVLERLALTEKALELACEEAHSYIVESEYYWFGVYSADTFDWFDELSKDKKIAAHCEYFLNKASEELKDE